MNITLFTRPKSVLTVGLALLLAFDPNLIFQWTGLVLGDAGTLLGRILGLVYLGIAIELWFVRSNSDLPARNALLLTAVDCSVVALLVQVQLAGLMNVLGWGADCRVPRLRPGIPLVRHASRQEWRRTRKPFLIQAICTFLISPDSSPFVPSALLVATGARGRLILSTTRISCRRT
jgi:hypothetical protein